MISINARMNRGQVAAVNVANVVREAGVNKSILSGVYQAALTTRLASGLMLSLGQHLLACRCARETRQLFEQLRTLDS